MRKPLFWLICTLIAALILTACADTVQAPSDPEPATPTEESEQAEGKAALQGEPAESSAAEEAEATEETEETVESEEATEPSEATAEVDELIPQADTISETAARAETAEKRYGLVVTQLNDRGFNDLAWAGMQRAAEELGVAVEFAQDRNPATAGSRINQFINQGYEGIVTVGFEMARATEEAAQANPEVDFAIVDFPNQTGNDRGLLFAVDKPSFLAGYLAAGMTESGVVCTYGGQKIPPVLIFMVGFEHGVEYYNQQNEADVQVLGWQTDPTVSAGGEGVFAGNFINQVFGQTIAEAFADQGCDIIFPVAGAVGLGTAEVAAENDLTVIGVDADQSVSNPEYADLYLTSVIKHVDNAVYESVKVMAEEAFVGGGNYIGTLENDGVGLAPFHSFEDQVPSELTEALDTIRQGLIAGEILTGWPIGVSQIETSLTAGNLNLAALRNATYNVEYIADGEAQLTNGEYRAPAAPESATEVVIRLGDQIAYGDLTGDGQDEAVVVLVSEPGGSGTFYDLAVVADRDGMPTQIASTLLGDRIELESLGVTDGLVEVVMVTQGPDDPLCCPTQTVVKYFEVQDGELVELSSEVVGDAAGDAAADDESGEASSEEMDDMAAALEGTTWVLTSFSFGQQPVIPGTQITAEFSEGRVSGSAGCNRYTASVTSDEDKTLTISAAAATRMACPPPIMDQEMQYLTALENVTQFSFLDDKLVLTYESDGSLKTLVFAPADSAEASPVDMLTGSTWQWVRFTDPLQQVEVDNPENYTVTFQPDGTLQIQADCNTASAPYTAADDGSLSVQPGPTTLALCPGESRGEEFLQRLGSAAIYFFQDGNLFIDLMADGGTMEFSPVTAGE